MGSEKRSAGPGGGAPAGAEKVWVEKFQKLNNGNPRVCQETFEWLWRYEGHFIPHSANWLIWKVEQQKARWNIERYTPSCIAVAAASHGAMFFSINGFDEKPLPTKDKANKEIKRRGHLHLDFDSKGDIGLALQDLRTLVFNILPRYDINPSNIPIYFSGSKGFHATVFDVCLRLEKGRTILSRIYYEIARKFKREIPTLDLSLYKWGYGQMYRLPNIKRSTGLHKIPLRSSEIAADGLTVNDILELAKSPRLIALPPIPKGGNSDG
ncbi:MAG: hypothetical protein CXZ00_15770 [Acidobacteria bacterium]|nr:MAG: hypothetical protein CXZ00_15770 [Acidobacteriota bacterium]